MRKIRRREELCNAMVSKIETLFRIIEYLLDGGSSKHIFRINIFVDTIFNIAEAQLTLKLLENSIFFVFFMLTSVFVHNNRKNDFLKYIVST